MRFRRCATSSSTRLSTPPQELSMSPWTLCSLATPGRHDIGDDDGHAGRGERAGRRIADADRLAAAGDQRNAGGTRHMTLPGKFDNGRGAYRPDPTELTQFAITCRRFCRDRGPGKIRGARCRNTVAVVSLLLLATLGTPGSAGG